MKRVLWGEFENDTKNKGPIRPDEVILPSKKAEKLKKLKAATAETENKM